MSGPPRPSPLGVYLLAEALVLQVEDADPELAEAVRSLLDARWYALPAEDQARLRARGPVTGRAPAIEESAPDGVRLVLL